MPVLIDGPQDSFPDTATSSEYIPLSLATPTPPSSSIPYYIPTTGVSPTPTPTDSSSSSTSNSTSDQSNNPSPGLSAGASAGIGVGVALGVLSLAALGFILYRRRNRRSKQTDLPEISPELGTEGQKLEHHEPSAEESARAELGVDGQQHELAGVSGMDKTEPERKGSGNNLHELE